MIRIFRLAEILSHVRSIVVIRMETFDGMRDAVKSVLSDLFGPAEFQIGGYFCASCDDVHATNEKCPRETIGVCMDCGRWVKLDRFGNGATCGHSAIRDRQFRWPNATPVGRRQKAYLQLAKRT